jgi:hypothetical protein
MNKKQNKQKGFLVLTMVLIVSAVVLAITTGVFLRSVGETKKISELEQSMKALYLANGCADYAVSKIASSTENGGNGWDVYLGDETLNIDDGTCDIYSLDEDPELAGSKWIKTESTVSGFIKRISVVVATNTPNLDIVEWEQVADFD